MDGLYVRRKVFWICFFVILSYASTTAQKAFAVEQSGDLNTNTQDSNNNNESTTNIGANAGSRTPMPTAIAPSDVEW